MNFEPIIDRILDAEAAGWRDGATGYVDHADDSGGATTYGITRAVAISNGYQGDMKDLPLSLAREIYRRRYIVRPNFDRIAQIDPDVGMELVDTGVNMGPSRAAEFFQRCLNVFNLKGSRYADVPVDGDIGPVTVEAFKAFMRWRGSDGKAVMLKALNCLQGAFYIELAESRPKDESFVFGQMRTRVEL